MILGIGIDTVEVERFVPWCDYSQKKLSRIFSPEEIEYSLLRSPLILSLSKDEGHGLQQPNKSAERFAARFAAREALFKALSYAYPDHSLPFLTLCSRIAVTKTDGRPYLTVVGDIGIDLTGLVLHLSLSHTRTYATALVIIERP